MKQKLKKLLAALIVLAMPFSNLITTALALETESDEKLAVSYVYVNGVKLTEGMYWKNGDTKSTTGSPTNCNAYYNNGTLYLKDAKITKAYTPNVYTYAYRCGIYSSGSLAIDVSGENSISDPQVLSTNIYAKNGITIKGSGKLYLEKGGYYDEYYDSDLCECAVATEGNIEISQTVVVIKSASSGIDGKLINLQNGASLSIDAFRGGCCSASFIINNSKLNVVGEETGLAVYGQFIVEGQSAVRIKGQRWAAFSDIEWNSILIYAPNHTLIADGAQMSDDHFNLLYIDEHYKEVLIYSPTLSDRFVDVNRFDWYNDSVQWAVENNITSGTGPITFSPETVCSRGQIVTFLWNANGSPKMSGVKNPFKDVKSNDYYYDAVLWAVKNGVTAGTSATTFSPNVSCTRGQVVTLLYNASGNKRIINTNNPFRDVPSDQYYSKPVLWAVQNGITSGTSATTFSPNANCTRAQIVCFLQKDMK